MCEFALVIHACNSSVVLTCENSNYHCVPCVLDERNYYEMSSFVENRAERVMKNKATSARFIQYDNQNYTMFIVHITIGTVINN